MPDYPLDRPDAEWRDSLPRAAYDVLRHSHTEAPFSQTLERSSDGQYHCGACAAALFDSDAQFDSACGWPSFDAGHGVELVADVSHGHARTEVRCASCGSHLGHLFDDGPTTTGQRYCINALALAEVTP